MSRRDPHQAFAAALGLTELEPMVRGALDDVLARAEVAATDHFRVDLLAFAVALAGHGKADPLGYLRTVRAEDLALASACASGDARGLAYFEQLYFREIDRAHARVRRGAVDPQDFAQRIRERLFVATEVRRPRIADYAGQGDLRTWFRVAVTRTLTTEAMRPNRDAPGNDEQTFDDVAGVAADPELDLLRRKYSREFQEAFRRTLSSLDDRDRAILRKVVIDRQGIDGIAAVYQIHRATAARWIQRAREGVVLGVRRDLVAHLRVPAPELESILRLVAGEVEVSVRLLMPTSA